MRTTSIVRSSRLIVDAYPRRIPPPASFAADWNPALDAIEYERGRFALNLDPASLRVPTATTYYVDIATGSDANPGTIGSPFKSIWWATNIGANATIYVKAGVYTYDNSWRQTALEHCNVIGVSSFATLAPGAVVSSIAETPGSGLGAWSNVGGGTPNTWQASQAAAPYAVIDAANPDANGMASYLTIRASIALVEANPGSYFHSAGQLYVRAANSRAPDSSIRSLRSSAINGFLSVAKNVTIENVAFEGGNPLVFNVQNCATATFIDCAGTHGQQDGIGCAAIAAGANQTINIIRGVSAANTLDGFAYTTSGAGSSLKVLEVDCAGIDNGRSAGSNQGSTAHFTAGNAAVTILRIGGRYLANEGTYNVADVGGCKVWMLGSRCDGTRGASGDGGVYCGDTGTTWLHGCVLGPSTNADIATDNAGGTVNVYGTNYAATTGAGTVQRFTP